MKFKKNVVILGSGGHSKVLMDALQKIGINVLGFTDSDKTKMGLIVGAGTVLGDDSIIAGYDIDKLALINGLGSIDVGQKRRMVFESYKTLGFEFVTVIHPKAIVSDEVLIEEGAQIMAGAVIQTGAKIGVNCIVNTGAIVDHDCVVGNHVHVASGATLAGNVTVGDCSHIGTGATVIQGVKIGKNCLIAAGSVVVRDIFDGMRVAGVPAKEMKK